MLKELRKEKNESESNYQLFLQYLFAENRSIEFVAEESGKSIRQIYRIAKKHNWKERVNSSIQQENQKLKAKFALKQKEKLNDKLDLLNSTDDKIMQIKTMLLYKGEEYLPKDLPAEKYIERANKYISLQLKLQKFERNFQADIENYDINEEIELEDIKDQIEREMKAKPQEQALTDSEEIDTFEDEIKDEDKEQPIFQAAHYNKLRAKRENGENDKLQENSPLNNDIYCHPEKPHSDDPEVNAVLERL